MNRSVLRREELFNATLCLGGAPIELADYATTGLRIVTVGPSGIGKSNAGCLIAEQLSDQGWVSVIVDPEGELESLYGEAVRGADELSRLLESRTVPIIVVSARNASEFLPYGRAILDAADKYRKPIFLMVDEGQLFSVSHRKKGDIGEATEMVTQMAERGRKRALDLFVTTLRFSGSLHRSLFTNKNLSLIGLQEDPTAWAALAPQFRASQIEYNDLATLAPGEFFCFSRRGVERVQMPMAEALQRVAPKAKIVKPTLPATFSQWDRAMRDIPTPRLRALSDPVVALLSAVTGLSNQQMLSGSRALADELECRA